MTISRCLLSYIASLAILTFPSASTALQTSSVEKAQVGSYKSYLTKIEEEIQNPEFSPWKTKLIAFDADAKTIYSQTQAVRLRCVPKQVEPKKFVIGLSLGNL